MNGSRLFQASLWLLVLFLAVVGFQAWSSGEPYLRLLGLIMAGGAAVLALFAGLFWIKKQAAGDRASSGIIDLGRRLILLGIALYALGTPLYAVAVSGKIPTLSFDQRRMIALKAEPQSFWLMAGLHAVPGLYCLFLALRRRG